MMNCRSDLFGRADEMVGGEHMDMQNCTGCKHYIGAGLCRLNLERECGEGGHEAYEPRGARSYTREEFVDAAVSCGWGNKSDVAEYIRENRKSTYTTEDLMELRRARPVRYAAADPKRLVATDGGGVARTTKHYCVYNGHDV